MESLLENGDAFNFDVVERYERPNGKAGGRTDIVVFPQNILFTHTK